MTIYTQLFNYITETSAWVRVTAHINQYILVIFILPSLFGMYKGLAIVFFSEKSIKNWITVIVAVPAVYLIGLPLWIPMGSWLLDLAPYQWFLLKLSDVQGLFEAIDANRSRIIVIILRSMQIVFLYLVVVRVTYIIRGLYYLDESITRISEVQPHCDLASVQIANAQFGMHIRIYRHFGHRCIKLPDVYRMYELDTQLFNSASRRNHDEN